MDQKYNVNYYQSPLPHVAYALHRKAHEHFMGLGYALDSYGFTMDDRYGIEEAIISAFLNLTELTVA